MIQPEPDFLRSFAALERSIRALPARESPLPAPEPPDAEVLEAWLEPYRSWNLPQVYLDYVARYGGVCNRESPLKVVERSLAQLLASRTRRAALGRIFRTRYVLLCPDSTDGDLCLIGASNFWGRIRALSADNVAARWCGLEIAARGSSWRLRIGARCVR